MPFSPEMLRGEHLPDAEQDLIAKAFEKNCSVIASYSAIPASTHIIMKILEHGEAPSTPGLGGMGVPPLPLSPPSPCPAETVETPVATTPLDTIQSQDLPRQVLQTLKPWKCTDETMEIVIIRSHLEVRRVEEVPVSAKITQKLHFPLGARGGWHGDVPSQ